MNISPVSLNNYGLNNNSKKNNLTNFGKFITEGAVNPKTVENLCKNKKFAELVKKADTYCDVVFSRSKNFGEMVLAREKTNKWNTYGLATDLLGPIENQVENMCTLWDKHQKQIVQTIENTKPANKGFIKEIVDNFNNLLGLE